MDEGKIPHLDDLRTSLTATREQGRLTCFILGAGASLSAGIPGMRDVYGYLSAKIETHVNDINQPEPARAQLRMVAGWLDALSKGNTSRSLAARALGVLQRSYELEDEALARTLANVWGEFAADFLTGSIASKRKPIWDAQPSVFHRFVAACALNETAIPLSVNFDGLTQRAISAVAAESEIAATAVILSDASQLERFALGARRQDRLVPVIKVWGDVFHAVCRRRQCPKYSAPVPIYALASSPPIRADGPALLRCPECRTRRQLQIYFAGYEEKERVTYELIEAFYRHYGNRIGTIVISGLSGEWDDLLIRLVRSLASTAEKLSPQSKRTSDRRLPFVFCIDPSRSFLVDELTRTGVRVVHLASKGGADEVAEALSGWIAQDQSARAELPLDDVTGQPDKIWLEPIAKKIEFPKILKEKVLDTGNYLDDMRRLRQLGLKTRMINLDINQERNHNRFIHSRAAAFIGSYWMQTLIKKLPERFGGMRDVLRSVVPLALINHDIGHVPFTHLAEEMFHEVNWSTRPWSQRFRHDEQALELAWPKLRLQWEELSKSLASSYIDEFPSIVGDTVAGSSGLHFLDAIVNSPLDADKIDYIFRDCIVTNQSLHLPGIGDTDEKQSDRIAWLEEFFGDQVLLESGAIGLQGKSGHHAAQLLEERLWLYKNSYLLPRFRVVERLARHILLLWLLSRVEVRMRAKFWTSGNDARPILLGDSRFSKGCEARDLLWNKLQSLPGRQGEPDLLLKIIDEMRVKTPWASGPRATWIENAEKVFKATLQREGTAASSEDILRRVATWSERIYFKQSDIVKIEEIARELEIKNPYTILFDVTSFPKALSYSDLRSHSLGSSKIICDCFAVPHHDPDRWQHATGTWIPLSKSRFSDRDRHRYGQIIVLSPSPHDEANVRHFEDRLRNLCRHGDVSLFDAEPDLTN